MNLPDTFTALGDATRFAIVERLMEKGELPVNELLDVNKLSAPAISRHLKVLRKAKIVNQRIDKQRRMYSVEPKSVQLISEWTMSHQAFWNKSLDRLERALMTEVEK